MAGLFAGAECPLWVVSGLTGFAGWLAKSGRSANGSTPDICPNRLHPRSVRRCRKTQSALIFR